MMSLFLVKLFDPISFALALAVVQFSRMKWIILLAAICAAVAGETIVVSIQQAETWGQGLPIGLLAGLVQASAVFGLRSLVDARKQTLARPNASHKDPPANDKPPDRHDETVHIGVDEVGEHLEKMGYRLTIVGAGYAIMQRKSGFSAVEVASQIALHSLALDFRSAATNTERTAEIVKNATRIVELLNDYRTDGMMHPVQWENDTKAIAGVAFPGRQREAWLESTLSNPMVGETRLAVRTADDDWGMLGDVL